MNKLEYREYLKSKWWKKISGERRKIDGFKCVICKSKKNLNVHHLSYKNVGCENTYTDLITLCHKCHSIKHGKVKKIKKKNKRNKLINWSKKTRKLKRNRHKLICSTEIHNPKDFIPIGDILGFIIKNNI
jgi:5-methylcytosine-specific restriction endonuclease McrA